MIKDSDQGVGGISGPGGTGTSFPRTNRRHFPRIQARLNIRTDGAMPGTMTTRNISLGGAFAETSLVFPIGTKITCVLAPQRGVGGNKEIRFRAKVLRSGAEAERGKTVNLAAVQFMEVKQNDLDALRDLLQDLSGVVFSENPTP